MRPSYNLDVPVDSARHNLASTFVNAFVNAGFSRDKLVSVEEGNKWMYKNKQHGNVLHNQMGYIYIYIIIFNKKVIYSLLTLSGMLSAAASLGLIHLWDVHGGLTPIDKYLYTSEEHIKVNIKFVFINVCIIFIT